jgi:uncharacterized membrane protein
VSEPPSWSPPSGWAPEQPPPSYPPGGAPGKPPGWQPSGQQPGWQQPGWQQPGQPGWGAGPGAFPPPPPPPPKPGIIALRPLGVGEILDGAISALRAHPRIMLGLSAVVAVITQVITVPVTWLLLHDAADATFSFNEPTTSTSSPGQDVAFAASSVTAAAVQVLVALVASLVLTGILTVVVSRAVLGQQISARAAWEQARPRIPALLGVSALVVLIVVGIAVVTMAPGVLLVVGGAPGAVVGLAFVLGGLVLVGLSVYLYAAFALAPPVIVLERQPVVASLRRSRALVRGAWWRTFGILVLVNVIAQVINNILNIPFLVITMVVAYFAGDGSGLNVYEVLPLLISAVGTIVASAVTWPFTAVSTALLYVDRRMRREALDIELARAAGVAPAGQPTLRP